MKPDFNFHWNICVRSISVDVVVILLSEFHSELMGLEIENEREVQKEQAKKKKKKSHVPGLKL